MITAIYAGLLTLFYLALSVRVVRGRRQARVSLGDGGDTQLLRRVRAHGNFAEYVPLGLVLIALAELQGAPGWIVHALAALLLAGRVAHAWSVSRESVGPGRVIGMVLTFAVLGLAALLDLALGLLGWPMSV